MRTNSAAFQHQAGHASYYGSPQPSTNCGSHFSQPPGNQSRPEYLGHHAAAGFEKHKRQMEIVDDFLSSAKRRHIDSTSYAQIRQSLLPLHGLVPLQTGAIAAGDYIAP